MKISQMELNKAIQDMYTLDRLEENYGRLHSCKMKGNSSWEIMKKMWQLGEKLRDTVDIKAEIVYFEEKAEQLEIEKSYNEWLSNLDEPLPF